MPELLTESFCERCGTRYTFESAAPAKTRTLGGIKTLSKGLKNYVLSDDTSLDEALAAARSDRERELTAQQLDAFHEAFNFCMTCRQYTCANCWNQAEGRCLTCAPHLGQEIMPAPFPDLGGPLAPETVNLDGAWPTIDLPVEARAEAREAVYETDIADRLARLADLAPSTNGAGRTESAIGEALAAADAGTIGSNAVPEAAASSEAESVGVEPEPVAAAPELPPVAAEPEAEPVTAAPEPEPTVPEAELPPVAAAAEPEVEPIAAAGSDFEPAVEPEAPGGVAAASPARPTTIEDRAAAAAARTADLLAKFRPIDQELAAYEASMAARDAVQVQPAAPAPEPEVLAAVKPEPVAAEPELVAAGPEPEPVGAAAETAPEPAAAAEAAPEPVAAAPEPVVEPEPVAAAAEAAPEPVASAPPTKADLVEQPTWRIVAPDVVAPTPSNGHPATDPGIAAAATGAPPAPAAPTPAPQWPAAPEWPAAAPTVPFLANRPASRSAITEALWAASARDVVAAQAGGAPSGGVQPCGNCGLSLSATARFCRRCGSRQGG